MTGMNQHSFSNMYRHQGQNQVSCFDFRIEKFRNLAVAFVTLISLILANIFGLIIMIT